jgi:hypothetical protein
MATLVSALPQERGTRPQEQVKEGEREGNLYPQHRME